MSGTISSIPRWNLSYYELIEAGDKDYFHQPLFYKIRTDLFSSQA